jgi:hypothetical protein
MGVGHIYRKSAVGKDIDQHQFVASSASNVTSCIERLWPYIGTVKRNQIKRNLALYETAMGRPYG